MGAVTSWQVELLGDSNTEQCWDVIALVQTVESALNLAFIFYDLISRSDEKDLFSSILIR